MSDNSVIAKSGWLFKLLDTGWAQGWVELYRDGYLKYYENDHSPNAEDVIFMPTECILIKTGTQVTIESNVPNIPSHRYSSQCLFSVSTSNKVWTFCGETLDDMRAWQLALEQARLLILPSRSIPRVPYASVLEMSPNYCPSDGGGSGGANGSYGLTPSIYLPAYTTGSYTYYPSTLCDSLSFMSSQYSSLASSDQHHPHHHNHQQQPGDQARLAASLITASHSAQLTSIPGPMFPHPRPDGRDVAFGMLAGAAVGSVVWGSPYFWW